MKNTDIEFSTINKKVNKPFYKVASEIVGAPIQNIDIRRHVADDVNYGTLTVYVYADLEDCRYWSLGKDDKAYRNLPSRLSEFETILKEKKI